MKTISLTKTTRCIQLGHLYEHIICRQIEIFLASHHLYPLLDYDVDGKTFHGGIIHIQVDLYSDDAIKLANGLTTLDIDISEENVSKMAGVILAEIEEPISCTSYEDVITAIRELHTEPWQSMDDLAQIDAKKIRLTARPFYIAEGEPLPARKLAVSILLDPDFTATYRHLLPLFRHFAWLIMASYQTRLSNTSGYFSFDDKFYSSKQKVGLTNIFKVANANDIYVDVEDNLQTCIKIANELLRPEVLRAYIQTVRTISYQSRSDFSPNPQYTYEDTLIFIGAKGWREIATMENVELLLTRMSVEVKFGRKKVSAPLIEN